MSGPTKAELSEAMHRAQALAATYGKRLGEMDDEARAIDACVKAVAELRTSGTYDRTKHPDREAIRRVLDHLATRFEIEPRRELLPCDRPHLEDATDEQLIARLRGWAMP